MKYLDFREKLEKYIVFSLSDIRAIDPEFRRRQLNEWQDRGYVKKIRRGHYIFKDVRFGKSDLFKVSNRIYGNSYVSLESALSFYGLIPEGVFTITAVSTKNTAYFTTPLTTFSYRHIKPILFFGYSLLPDGTKIASIEKLLLDYIYFHPEMIGKDDFDAWRFNSVGFLEQADLDVLQKYVKKYPKSAQKRLEKLLILIKNASYA